MTTASATDSFAPALDHTTPGLLVKIVGTLLLILFGCLTALGAGEVALRLMPAPSAKKVWSDRPAEYFAPDTARSLQDYSYSATPAPGVFRIAVLGDSFTFATQMQFFDSFPKQLERYLNLNSVSTQSPDQDAPFTRVEVINYGVPGFSTSHEADMMKKAVREGAHLVLLQITLNDPQLKPYTPRGISGKNDFGPASASSLGAHPLSWSKLWQFIQVRLHNSRTHTKYTEYYHDLFNNKRTFGPFLGALRTIARRGKKKNIPVIATTFPLFGLPLDESYPFDPIHQKVDTALKDLGIPHLDLRETFRGLPLDRIQLVPGADFHPNELGHRIAAETLYKWLFEIEAVPSQFKAKRTFGDRLDIRLDKNNPL